MFTTFTAVDPVSVLVGVALGCVVSRCVFLIWKERQDKQQQIELIKDSAIFMTLKERQ